MFGPLKSQFGTLEAYQNSIRGKPEEHNKFLRQLARYIAVVNDDAGGYIAALEKNVGKVGRGPLLQEKRRLGHIRVLKMTFVHEDKFEALYKGTVDAKRFGALATDKLPNGIELKGYWCKGDFNTHLDGHDLHQFEDEQGLEMQEDKNDKDIQLAKNQALTMFAAEEKVRKDICFTSKSCNISTYSALSDNRAAILPPRPKSGCKNARE